MNIELTINAGPELIRFAEIIAGGFNRQTQTAIAASAIVAEPVITTPGTTRTRRNATPAVEAKAEEKTEETATEEKEEPIESTKMLTVEDLRSLCQEKARSGKRVEVKSLLSSFKVEKVTELKEADYSVFAEKIEAL